MTQQVPGVCFYQTTPLEVQPRFSFVNVFREAADFCRVYDLPFISVSACTREDAQHPSWSENLKTGEVHRFHKNDIRLLLPGVARRYLYTPANEHLCIHFRLEIFPGAGAFPEDGACHIINSPQLRRECEAVFREPDPVKRLIGCQIFALNICRMHWPQQMPPNLAARRAFEPVLRHLRDTATAQTRIDSLAAMLGCSPDSFLRRFRAVFGVSPKKYLQKELFSRATQLLANPALSVKEIAAQLEFSSEFYFSKFFRRHAGVSPSEYRQRSAQTLFPEK